MDQIFPAYTAQQWIALVLAAFLTGMAKAGLKGMSMLVVPMLVVAFGGRPSTGILLPILCMADILAVRHYHQHANWKYLTRLMPPAILGVLVAFVVGLAVSDGVFTNMIAWIIIGTVVLLVFQEFWDLSREVEKRPFLGYGFGWLGGFTTMIGNAAGPVMAVYLLATRLPKQNYMGTAAWFFLIINLFKIPFHVFAWQTITWSSFAANLAVFPMIFVGVGSGVWIVHRIPDRVFRFLIIAMTFAMAVNLIWQRL